MFSFPSKFGGNRSLFLRHVYTCTRPTSARRPVCPYSILCSVGLACLSTPNTKHQRPTLFTPTKPSYSSYILSCIAAAFPSKQIKNNERRSWWNKRLFSTRRKIIQSSRRSGKRLVVVPCRIWSSRWTFSGIDLDGCFDALDF
jgi:hypothetical protein